YVPGVISLKGREITVPGDISSAAFFLVLGTIHPDAELLLEGVGVNPTRTGILDVLQTMGAKIEMKNRRVEGGEPVADLLVRSASLKGVPIGGAMIPRLIDEIPVLAVAATQAEGITLIRDAEELKVKESDRITAMVTELRKLGARIEATSDGMVIEGPTPLHGGEVEVYHDHRIAMSLAVAGSIAQGKEPVAIRDAEIAVISYPHFFDQLAGLGE
ncbi:MAG: 3-phosphoshikimate 1-carboxyvinyltransferase, partial [Thermicanus sp.]|nr:3-phosphoshikimate 1-carboxyvinyltransferase [Thermicanus sp.]